jgi:hypothetical protein
MPYERRITRENPTAFLFLPDKSGSMGEEFGGNKSRGNNKAPTKADRVNDTLNRQLANITIECSDQGEVVKDYFDVAVIEYGNPTVQSAWKGELAGEDFVPVSRLKDSPLRVETRTIEQANDAGDIDEVEVKHPVWFDPESNGGTPMCEALELGHDYLKPWIDRHQESFPPVAVNVTDGKATDGDPRPAADKLRGLSTKDGDILLFNIHISSADRKPILYPDSTDGLSSESARHLFEMSSPLPPIFQEGLRGEGYEVGPGSRGYVFHADAVEMIRSIQSLIGTTLKQKRLPEAG